MLTLEIYIFTNKIMWHIELSKKNQEKWKKTNNFIEKIKQSMNDFFKSFEKRKNRKENKKNFKEIIKGTKNNTSKSE